MILNLTSHPYDRWNAMQRLAARGYNVVEMPCRDYVEFEDGMNLIDESKIKIVLVDMHENDHDCEFINDVVNFFSRADICTLCVGVDVEDDQNIAYFELYE